MSGSKKPRPAAEAMGRRIAARRAELSINQSDLARILSVRVQSVQQWEAGQTTPKTTRLSDLAAALRCSVHELTSDVAASSSVFDGTTEAETRIHRLVPLISWVQAGNWQEAFDPYHEGHGVRDVPAHYEVSASAYALCVRGDSMEPRFPDGCTIIVDPAIEPKNGHFVVVRLDDSNEATFKQLVVDGPHRLLKPLNSRYPIIKLDGAAIYCGVVVESYQRHV